MFLKSWTILVFISNTGQCVKDLPLLSLIVKSLMERRKIKMVANKRKIRWCQTIAIRSHKAYKVVSNIYQVLGEKYDKDKLATSFRCHKGDLCDKKYATHNVFKPSEEHLWCFRRLQIVSRHCFSITLSFEQLWMIDLTCNCVHSNWPFSENLSLIINRLCWQNKTWPGLEGIL